MRKKYVYLLRAEESGSYKIGFSKHPEKRLKEVQTGNPEKVTLVDKFCTQYYKEVEDGLHGHFQYSRKEGEWFNLNLEEVYSFKDRCRDLEKFFLYRDCESNYLI